MATDRQPNPISPDDIQRPGTARDPGIQARASSVALTPVEDPRAAASAALGKATENYAGDLASFSKSMSEVSNEFRKMYERRQETEDYIFSDDHNLRFTEKAAKIKNDMVNGPDASRPDFPALLDKRLSDAYAETTQELLDSGTYSPSGRGRLLADHYGKQTRIGAARDAAAVATQVRVATAAGRIESQVQQIVRSAAEHQDYDRAVKELDPVIRTASTIYPEHTVADNVERYKAAVFGGVMQGKIAELGRLGASGDAKGVAAKNAEIQAMAGRVVGTIGPNADERTKTIYEAATKNGVNPLWLQATGNIENRGGIVDLKNKDTSAFGLFQITKGTAAAVGRALNLPEDYTTWNAQQQSEAAAYLGKQNTDILSTNLGRPLTQGEFYLGHFLGVSDALQVMKGGDINAPFATTVAPGNPARRAQILEANPQLRDFTNGQVIQWAEAKMAAETQRLQAEKQYAGFDLSNKYATEKAIAVASLASRTAEAQYATIRGENAVVWDTRMQQAKLGLAPVPTDFELDSAFLGDADRHKFKTMLTAVKAENIETQRIVNRFKGADESTYNAGNKTDREEIDKVFVAIGANQDALNVVLQKTGGKILPTAAVEMIKNDLRSGDPERTARALDAAELAITKNRHVFVGHQDASFITNAADAYSVYKNSVGQGDNKAAAMKWIADQKSSQDEAMKVKRKEQEDALALKHVTPTAVSDRFGGWFVWDPAVGGSHRELSNITGLVQDFFKEAYRETGNVSTSLDMAIKQAKEVVSETTFGGTKHLMFHAPQKSATFRGIDPVMLDKATESLAQEALKGYTGGLEIPISKIQISTLGVETRRAWEGNELPLVSGLKTKLEMLKGENKDSNAGEIARIEARIKELSGAIPYKISYTDANGVPVDVPDSFVLTREAVDKKLQELHNQNFGEEYLRRMDRRGRASPAGLQRSAKTLVDQLDQTPDADPGTLSEKFVRGRDAAITRGSGPMQ